ncbi:MAG TPA: hypothetical protein VGK42_03655 [Candidatus Dormibacteraeota bacterium]
MEPEEDLQPLTSLARAGRALAVMAASVLAIGVGGFAYLHPAPPPGAVAAGAVTDVLAATPHRLIAIDFVAPSVGWVLAEGARDFVIMHTTDAGNTWSRQLAGASGRLGEYVHFFDRSRGVVVVLGPSALMFKTADGGKTWSRSALDQGGGNIVSAVFTSARDGWLLADTTTGNKQAADLLRTRDGGRTWSSLGDPALPQDVAYRVVFTDFRHGWLYSSSSGPYAYTSSDGGETWRRASLPAPPGGWLGPTGKGRTPDRFLVAARPTVGAGVLATVIAMVFANGRPVDGEVGYAALGVRAFDAGGAVTWIYPRFGDPTPFKFVAYDSAGEPVRFGSFKLSTQVQMTSADEGATWSAMAPPSSLGAIGYLDALNWWWIGSGRWSTSYDGGRTWTRVRSLGVPEPVPGSLQLLDANHAWFGAMAGSRPLLERTEDGGVHWNMYLLPPITA